MDCNKSAVPRRFKSVAEALGERVDGLSDHEGAEMACAGVRRLLESMDISSRFGDYGISENDVEKMAERAERQTRLFGQNARSITPRDIGDIYMRGLR